MKRIVIKPKKGIQLLNITEIFNYKDLLYFMVLKDIKVLYRQTILGFSWAILRPFFSMVIFSIIFGNMASIPSDGLPYPVFSYVALVPWIYFSTSLIRSTQSLIVNKSIFTKVYFPRIIITITPVIAGLIDFLIALSIVFLMMLWYGIAPTINIVWLPLLVFIMILCSLGIGLWLSALAVQYRDVRYAVQFISQILMYAAPVVWPISLLTDKFGDDILLWYGIYPMAGVIDGFRSALLGNNPMPWLLILLGLLSSIVIFVSGIIYFRYKEKIFADVA